MKLDKTVGMATDHSYHGNPVEHTFISLFIDETLTEEQVALARQNQERALREHAKRMPHHYWITEKNA